MTLNSIASTVQQTQEWLHALTDSQAIINDAQAYTALRAVLHRLRDRMTPEEAAQLGAQLPTLVRGLYYEGWKPARTPTRERSREEFLESLRAELSAHPEIDARQALLRVWSLLRAELGGGELDEVLHMMPGEVQEMLNQETPTQ